MLISNPTKSNSILQEKSHLPIINSLRGLAAFMVAFHHFSRWGEMKMGLYAEGDIIPAIGFYGNLGVYVFFVISGFVIPYSLIKTNYTLQHFFKFILKRGIRIEIPYIASIALFLLTQFIASKIFEGRYFYVGKGQLLSHFLYLVPFTHYKWISIVFWTLAVEFQYYLLIALILPLFTKTNQWIQTLVLIALASCTFFRFFKPEIAFLYSHGGIFAIGIVTCLFYLKKAKLWQYLLILVYGSLLTWYFRNTEIAVATVLTSLIICFVKLDLKIGSFMGKISYSLYLIHIVTGQFLIELLILKFKVNWPNHVIFILSLAVAIFCSWLFWMMIEEPSKKLASRVKVGKTT